MNNTPRQKDFRELLYPLFRAYDGKSTKMAYSLFSSILGEVKKYDKNTTKRGFAKFLFKRIRKKPNSKLSCFYCGSTGANPMASYVFPFITQLRRYPNTYSWGHIESLNFCAKCMFTSFAAINRLLFNANRLSQKSDHISVLMFFSKDERSLHGFYNGFIEQKIDPTTPTNMNILRHYDKIWYPEEFLAVLIDDISSKIDEFRSINVPLGALIFSFIRTSSKGRGKTNIYDSFDIINELNPFIIAFSKLKKNTFKILFRNLRSGSTMDVRDFVERRRLFRKLLLHHKLDWKAIEGLVIFKASDDQDISFLKPFISAILDELALSEKLIFDVASGIGSDLGEKLRKNEKNPKRRKKYIFDFRRCRRPQDFLSLLNLIQSQLEMPVYNAETFTSDKDYEIAKTSFLVGFSNALFRKDPSIEKSK